MIRSISRVLVLVLVLFLVGCATPPAPQQPLIIGQRVLVPDPSTTINVPPLIPPAKQWYLVDDVGIGIWLCITPPSLSSLNTDH
jgi:hypothetical protein